MDKRFDVFGMCNALFDIQAEVADATLGELMLDKGAMMLMEEDRQRQIVPRIYEEIVHTEAGGSGANTMIGLALLGARACYTSRVGDDEHGDMYRAGLEARGVKANLGVGSGQTGISLILVTPDAQRTMCTYLGRSRELVGGDVNLDDLRASRYLYVTGYLWDTEGQKEAVVAAMRAANENGVHVALSLADPFCVHRHKEDFLRLLREHVDIVIGNRDEALALTDTTDVFEAARILAAQADIVAITNDSRGSIVCQGAEVHEIPVYPVDAVDTTGAGDMYAAGFLYGITSGMPLPAAGRIGSFCAAQVVAKLGPRLDRIDRAALSEFLAAG